MTLGKKEVSHTQSSYQRAGEEAGIRKLVDDFYAVMAIDSEARRILRMHTDELSVSKDKLSLFLCQWLNGPQRYKEKYGSMVLPVAHRHLDIGEKERDLWLNSMKIALSRQPYPEELKQDILQKLRRPADLCRTRES